MKQTDYQEIAEEILTWMEDNKKESVSWEEIVAYVRNILKINVTNWRRIRVAIQFMEKANVLYRDSDLHIEVYHLSP